jgi:putative ABC transport system permease protein
MGFWGFVWKNLLRRPARALLTMLGLAIAVTAVVALVGVSRGFERSLSDLYTKRGVDIVVVRKGFAAGFNSDIDARFSEEIRKLPGVLSVDDGLADMIDCEGYMTVMNGWAPDANMLSEVEINSGRKLKAGDAGKAMIGIVQAGILKKKVGDKINLYGDNEPFEIVGVFTSMNVYNNGSVVVLLEELQELTEKKGKVTGILVHASPGASEEELTSLAERINALSTVLNAKPTKTFVENVQQLQIGKAMAWVVSAIAVLIGSVGVLNTMVMSVYERAKEIGVLRAIGWRKSRVVWMVICEALLLSLGGATVGILCAVLLTRYLSTFPLTANIVQGRIEGIVMVQGLIIAVIVGVGGAIYPAWWGASLVPREALQKK